MIHWTGSSRVRVDGWSAGQHVGSFRPLGGDGKIRGSVRIRTCVIYIIRVIINFDKETRKIVVQSLVLSQINYCISIWSTNTTLPQKVEKIQKFVANVSVRGKKKYDHVSPVFRELRWTKVRKTLI